MKTLHLLMSMPNPETKKLIECISQGERTEIVHLYREETDFEKLVDLFFECDRIISWW
jgi:hypothetical protein